MEEDKGPVYVGRFAHVNLPYRAGGSAGWTIEDFKYNPELGVLTLHAEGSNYRTYRERILLSAGAKKALQEFKDNKRKDVTVAVEMRKGRMPKMYIARDNTRDYIAIISYGSGYRGGAYEKYTDGITRLVRVSGGGSLGTVAVELVHVRPPAIFYVERSGRLYGSPPYAIAVFTEDDVKVDEVTEEELNEIMEIVLAPKVTEPIGNIEELKPLQPPPMENEEERARKYLDLDLA